MYRFFRSPYMQADGVGGSAEDEVKNEDIDDELNKEDDEPNDDEDGEKQDEVKEDKVPLKKYLSEKQRRKDIEKRLKDLEEKSIDSDILTYRDKIKKKYLEKDYEEKFAEDFAEELTSIYAELKKTSKKNDDSFIDEEISDLAESDPIYEDASTYKDQIKDLMKKSKISAEEAYIKLRGKTRLKEMLLNKEQVNAAKRKEVDSKKLPESKGGGKAKDPYPLDDKDKKALKQLQETFPNAGWTAEKYFKKIYKNV